MFVNTRIMIRAVLLTAIVLFNINCDSATQPTGFASGEVDDLFVEVSEELSLSSTQVTSFQQTMQAHDQQDRPVGYLWYVADSLSQILTSEQIDKLIDRTQNIEGNGHLRGLAGFVGGGKYYGYGRFRGIGLKGLAAADSALQFTDEQKDQIKAIHDSYRDQTRSLLDAFRDGSISRDDLIRGLIDLRAARKAEIRAVLTDDQIAQLDAFRAAREAELEQLAAEVKQVRDDVLGLDATESEAYDAINLEQLDAREVLVDQFEAGDITLATLLQEIAELVAMRSQSLDALLSNDQFTVALIHDALVVRATRRGHRSRRHNRR